ncbi:MAG: hypothetical protein ACD_13C00149G0011 [uncultured bacterium]|nr:MAG: hypothetical protein ACD_13C00149G0011 [uncultured bacterium]
MLLGSEINMLTQLDFDQIQKGAFPDAKFGSTSKVGDIINLVLPYIFAAAGIALLIYLVLGGLQMMTSRGDPKAMQTAQAKVTNAIIGFVIVFLAFTIVQLIAQLLGLEGTMFSQIFGGK